MADPIMELNGVSKNFTLKRKSIFSPQRLLVPSRMYRLPSSPGKVLALWRVGLWEVNASAGNGRSPCRR